MMGMYRTWPNNYKVEMCEAMEKYRRYLRLQLKKVSHFLPIMFLTATLLIACVGFLAVTIYEKNNSSENKLKVKIGLVGDTSNEYLEFALFALRHLDSSRFAIEIIEIQEEEEARQQMNNARLSAYIVIPDNFADLLEYGINTPITYVNSGATNVSTLIMVEIADEVSQIITDAENMLFAVQHFGYLHELPEAYQDETVEQLFFQIMDNVLARHQCYDIELCGISDGLSLVEYYISALAVFYILLMGISCCHMYVKRDMARNRILQSQGYGCGMQLLGEYGSYLLVVLFDVALAVGYVFLLFWIAKEPLVGLIEGLSEGGLPALFFSLVPVIFLISALQFCLFEAVSDVISGILLQLVFAIGMGYLSGCFYPVSFFPDVMQRISDVLPVGIALQFVQKNLSGQNAWKELVWILVYFAGALGIAFLLRKGKTEKGY